MVDSQQIVERSFYKALLQATVNAGYTLDPATYLPISPANESAFNTAKANIISTKGYFISIFGNGNNQAKQEKECPAIVIDMQGFFPGDMGLNRNHIEKGDEQYVVSESPYTTIDQLVNIHLVANNVEHLRLLHVLLNTAIPQRGYIKPYTYINKPFDGNIFTELNNFFSIPDQANGIMEKVYQFIVKDTLLEDLRDIEVLPPINDISVLLGEIEINKTI